MTLEEVHRAHEDRSVVPRADQGDRRPRDASSTSAALDATRRADAARAEAQGLLRPPPRAPAQARPRRPCASARHALGIRPVYKRVDTCAAEFATHDGVHVLDLRGGVRGAARPTARRSWCSAAGRTASARASSSTTAACTRRSRCARTASRPSWSTATRRPCRPTTTRPTGCTSSR